MKVLTLKNVYFTITFTKQSTSNLIVNASLTSKLFMKSNIVLLVLGFLLIVWKLQTLVLKLEHAIKMKGYTSTSEDVYCTSFTM